MALSLIKKIKVINFDKDFSKTIVVIGISILLITPCLYKIRKFSLLIYKERISFFNRTFKAESFLANLLNHEGFCNIALVFKNGEIIDTENKIRMKYLRSKGEVKIVYIDQIVSRFGTNVETKYYPLYKLENDKVCKIGPEILRKFIFQPLEYTELQESFEF